jgi:hypothetical protein
VIGPGGVFVIDSKPGSTEAHIWDDVLTLVRGPFSPLGLRTHWVKRHPTSNGLLTCGDTVEFADPSVDSGSAYDTRSKHRKTMGN